MQNRDNAPAQILAAIARGDYNEEHADITAIFLDRDGDWAIVYEPQRKGQGYIAWDRKIG